MLIFKVVKMIDQLNGSTITFWLVFWKYDGKDASIGSWKYMNAE